MTFENNVGGSNSAETPVSILWAALRYEISLRSVRCIAPFGRAAF